MARRRGGIRCPGCRTRLCEDAVGEARLRFYCRGCHNTVVVLLRNGRIYVVLAA